MPNDAFDNNLTNVSLALGIQLMLVPNHQGLGYGKSLHISMISNSVTHLQSYTNSAIADIARNSALISPETPREHRCRWRRVPILFHRMASVRVFRDVSQCFKCFMMFHNLLRALAWFEKKSFNIYVREKRSKQKICIMRF